MKPSECPSLNKVIEMLEGNTEQFVMHDKPFLYPPQEDNSAHSSLSLLQVEK